jgi:hypothetical protein
MSVPAVTPTSTRAPVTHRGLLALAAVLTAAALVLTGGNQIYDTNFYTLWEATALLKGDHPYRDFFEWGVPLQVVVSATMQLLSGYRLIGEFTAQWAFIIAGVVIALALGLRVSHSRAASVCMFVVALIVVAEAATFNYAKLFFYPLAIWIAWWYMDRPAAVRAAVFGLATAVAFLYRHDHGVYFGGAAVLTFALTRIAVPASRTWRSIIRDTLAYGAVAAVVVAPWVIVVQTSEGLPQYVRSRADLYKEWSASDSPYRTLRRINPIRTLMAAPAPPPRAGVISLEWEPRVDTAQRRELEREFGLQPIEGTDRERRSQYRIANIYDVELLHLDQHIRESAGVPWDRLHDLGSRLPRRDDGLLWMEQMMLVVPILLMAMSAVDLARSRHRREPVDGNTYRIVLAALFLAAIDSRLFRESSYFCTVAPVTAALAARLFPRQWRFSPWVLAHWAVTIGVLIVTGMALFVYANDSNVFKPLRLAREVPDTFGQLLSAPPIDAYQPEDEALRYDRGAWDSGEVDKGKVLMRYLHDCTRDGDRILVTGSTPYQVGYYTERAVAGGHVFWHHRWRSDPVHQRQSLALLEHESVPFAFSTHDPILDDFKSYPIIREYLLKNYVELEGAGGVLLVDTRRKPTGQFGALGFPCFR